MRNWIGLLLIGLVGGCSCGKDTEIVADADADTDADTDADADSDTDSSDDLCGEDLCASHEGEHDFVEEGAPADAAGIFDEGTAHPPGTDRDREPSIIYPNHETMFPINVTHIRHEWTAGANTLYHLEFVGPRTTVHVYLHPTNWEPSDEEWDWIAESNRGESVTFTVYGLDEANPDDVWQSTPITLYFSDANVEGAIYYWSTGSSGVMKGVVSSPIPIKFYTDPLGDDAGTCVACHTLSRDGERLAVGYGGERLREVSVPERETILPSGGGTAPASAWTTFSPDGSMIIVAASGVMTLFDADTGDPIGPDRGVIPIPDGMIGAHPDWNALGDRVAFTLATNGGNKDTSGGAIAVLPYDAGVWGEAQIIVPKGDGADNNFFPAWSPDSQWIAYVNAQESSKDAPTAILRLVAADGGDPVDLVRLNQRVNNVDGVVGVGNSMPRWAPSSRPGIFWIALSSLREYATLRPRDDKEDQIWIAAIDPTLADDPGYSAFWAPFQSIAEGNHRAFWTNSAEDSPCYCDEFCGDGLDNDCNGTADEAGCIDCQAEEICGNDLDDDCDCVVDDCVEEDCFDGLDNDKDGFTDFEDSDCIG
jgi:TolB protein